jgi:hypothetical protein
LADKSVNRLPNYLDKIFCCLLTPLMINPIRSMDLYNQTTILLLIISNRLLRKK